MLVIAIVFLVFAIVALARLIKFQKEYLRDLEVKQNMKRGEIIDLYTRDGYRYAPRMER